MTTTQTIITAVIGSTALSSLIQFFVTRYDSRHSALQRIANDLTDLKDDFQRSRAIAARIRILTASDEVAHGERHSKEWWDQILDDCTFYENYCSENPGFKNKKAEHATKHLNDIYIDVFQKNAFI